MTKKYTSATATWKNTNNLRDDHDRKSDKLWIHRLSRQISYPKKSSSTELAKIIASGQIYRGKTNSAEYHKSTKPLLRFTYQPQSLFPQAGS